MCSNGKPAQGGSEVGPLVSMSEPALVCEATPVEVCELPSAEVVLVTWVLRTFPVGVDATPRVIKPLRTGCMLAISRQWVKKKGVAVGSSERGHCEEMSD